jgi:hypothetical protein
MRLQVGASHSFSTLGPVVCVRRIFMLPLYGLTQVCVCAFFAQCFTGEWVGFAVYSLVVVVVYVVGLPLGETLGVRIGNARPLFRVLLCTCLRQPARPTMSSKLFPTCVTVTPAFDCCLHLSIPNLGAATFCRCLPHLVQPPQEVVSVRKRCRPFCGNNPGSDMEVRAKLCRVCVFFCCCVHRINSTDSNHWHHSCGGSARVLMQQFGQLACSCVLLRGVGLLRALAPCACACA